MADVLIVCIWVVLGPVIGIVEFSWVWVQYIWNCFWNLLSCSQGKQMSVVLLHLGCVLLLTTPFAMVLSVWSWVAGCLLPNSWSMIHIYMAFLAIELGLCSRGHDMLDDAGNFEYGSIVG
jgi:hypothetical protein